MRRGKTRMEVNEEGHNKMLNLNYLKSLNSTELYFLKLFVKDVRQIDEMLKKRYKN